MSKGTRAFTLIEILVVIAIIGILSSIAAGTFWAARAKTADSSIKANFHSVRINAALDYSANGNSYGTTAWVYGASSFPVGSNPPGSATGMFDESTIGNALAEVARQSGSISYGSNPKSYVIVARLKSSDAYWCVDSQGGARLEAAYGNTPTGPASNYMSGGLYECR